MVIVLHAERVLHTAVKKMAVLRSRAIKCKMNG